MHSHRHPIDQALLDDWQRNLPITPRPFMALAEVLGTTEFDVINRLRKKQESGQITRVGATCTPNTISASTLAAVAAPEDRIEEVANIIGTFPGVNHSYLRENDWNLWFVATGPNRKDVAETLFQIEDISGLRVLNLPLVRPFSLDLGFGLRDGRKYPRHPLPPDKSVLHANDRPIVQALMNGLPLVPTPFAMIAENLGITESEVIERVSALCAARIISRFGVIVRHRQLGWRANAMVVWDLSHDAITEAGPALASKPGVTLCYERKPVDGVWPYRLYSMFHARSRAEALDNLANAANAPELRGVPHLPLFSTRCFKQTGALIHTERSMA